MVRWVDLPRGTITGLGLTPAPGRGWYALLHFNGDFDLVTLLPGKRGCWKLAFKVELLRAAGVDTGDTIEFSLAPDTSSREPELPMEMQRAFQARPHLVALWAAHSVAQRRQLVRYILQSKSPEVQARRCWIFIDRLAETGRLSAE